MSDEQKRLIRHLRCKIKKLCEAPPCPPVEPCAPATVTWDGDTNFPLATLGCDGALNINCETLINGVVLEGGFYQYQNGVYIGENGTFINLNNYANIFTYQTGMSPTLEDFETQIGFTLINGEKFGDTIVFDNIGYSVGFAMFLLSSIKGYLKCSAIFIDHEAFEGNGAITNVFLPVCEELNQCFNGEPLAFIYAPQLTKTSLQCFSNCPSLTYVSMPVIQEIGPTTGINDVFFNTISNDITVIVPSTHQTSNGGNLEEDLQYLVDNNTVTFDWDGQGTPDWISDWAYVTESDIVYGIGSTTPWGAIWEELIVTQATIQDACCS